MGSDLAPVDLTTTGGRLRLTAYVWPDQVHRLHRLGAAFAVAADHPAELRQRDAASFVAELELVEGCTTVLWHSVMWQYLPRRDQAAVAGRIEELGRAATPRRRFAHLRAEPGRRSPHGDHEFLVHLRVWPGGEERLLGTSVAHGVPTTWE